MLKSGKLQRGFLQSCDAISIALNSVPMSSSGSVKLRYEKCLQVWGSASSDYQSRQRTNKTYTGEYE